MRWFVLLIFLFIYLPEIEGQTLLSNTKTEVLCDGETITVSRNSSLSWNDLEWRDSVVCSGTCPGWASSGSFTQVQTSNSPYSNSSNISIDIKYNNIGKVDTIYLRAKVDTGNSNAGFDTTSGIKKIVPDQGPSVSLSFFDTCSSVPKFKLTGGSTNGAGSTSKSAYLDSNRSKIPNAQFDPSNFGPGFHKIYYTDTNANGCSDIDSSFIIVHATPNADYESDSACLGNPVSLNNKTGFNPSTPQSISWQWDMDNNTTKTTKNVLNYQYSNFNKYNVTLEATTQFGCKDSITKTVKIHPVPTAKFTTPNSPVCKDNNSIKPNGNISKLPGNSSYTFEWFYDDGTSDKNKRNPSHNYLNSGRYVVKLEITSQFNCKDTATKSIDVYPEPKADFSTDNACFGNSVTLKNSSSISGSNASIASIEWDLGPTTIQNQQQPTYTYQNTGTYNVELNVNSAKGCTDTINKKVDIYPLPNPNFSLENVCRDALAAFNASGSSVGRGSIDSFEWKFGDGSTGSGQKTSHKYSEADTFTVSLITTSNFNCKDSLKKNLTVYPLPTARFISDSACKGSSVKLKDKSIIPDKAQVQSRRWNFIDTTILGNKTNPSYKYDSSGIYPVTLTVTTSDKCVNSKRDTVRVHPKPIAKFLSDSVCAEQTIEFKDSSQLPTNLPEGSDSIVAYNWNLDDQKVKNGRVVNTSYSDDGIKSIGFTVKTDKGCVDDTSKSIEIWPLPEAEFEVIPEDKAECVDSAYELNAEPSDGNIVNYLWVFEGANAKDTGQQVSHKYRKSGTKRDSLIVITNNGCRDTIDKKITINTNPEKGEIFGPDQVCKNAKGTEFFLDSSLRNNGEYKFRWFKNNRGDVNDLSNIQWGLDSSKILLDWKNTSKASTLSIAVTDTGKAKTNCRTFISKEIEKKPGESAPDRTKVNAKDYSPQESSGTGAILVCKAQGSNLRYEWGKTNKNSQVKTTLLDSTQRYLAIDPANYDTGTFRYWVKIYKNPDCKTKTFLSFQKPGYLDSSDQKNQVYVPKFNRGNSIKAFPNPVTNMLRIKGISLNEWTLELYDMHGNIKQPRTKENTIFFDKSWPEGVYILMLTNNKETLTEKIILSR
jgi:PKD repeat protein